MGFSSAYAKYDTGLQQGLKKKKKDLNTSSIRNTFHVVYETGWLNKAENGLKGCFWGRDSTAGMSSISAQGNKFTRSNVIAEMFLLLFH